VIRSVSVVKISKNILHYRVIASSQRQKGFKRWDLAAFIYRFTIHLPFTIHDLRLTCLIRHSQEGRTLKFAVVVVPRASRSEIAGEYDGALRVRIAAAPVEGAANRELQRLLAKKFKLPQNAIEIIAGTHSKRKIVRIDGADAATLEQLIITK
jgi:uncharacterized protein (TIGR00251 family)